jgi:hypothetical protein
MYKKIIVLTTIVVCTLPALSYGQILDVPEVVQEQTEWCWAATSTCVLNYYGNNVTQCTVAEYARTQITWHDFGTVSCCENPKGKCNYWNYNFGYPGSILEILKKWGIDNSGTGGSLTIDKIKQELGSGRPFIIRFEFKTSGGHFVVGHGIADSSVYYMDPWPGEGFKIVKYSYLLSNKEFDWMGTNVIKTNPVTPETITLLSPKDSSINQPVTSEFKWKKTSAVSYRFQCSQSSSFSNLICDTIIQDTMVRLQKLSSSTKYYWKVCGKKETTTDGPWSSIWRFTTGTITFVKQVPEIENEGISAHYRNGEVYISCTMQRSLPVNISIHSLQGVLLRTIFKGSSKSGQYTSTYMLNSLPHGNYILAVNSGNDKKMTLITHAY